MRLAIRVLLFVLVIAAVGITLTVMPAHQQIRTVAPALPNAEEIRRAVYQNNKPISVSYVATSSQKAGDRLLVHPSIVVQWANGDLFLIDAGMDAEGAKDFGKTMQLLWGADEAIAYPSVADTLGNAVSQVKGIGFTHLHIDHTQGVKELCKARKNLGLPALAAYQTSYQNELHNLHTQEGAELVNNSCLKPLPLNKDGINTLSNFNGLVMVPLGGHTPGSTLFAVAVGRQILLFAGDITNTKADLRANRGKGFFYSNLAVPEDTQRLEALREWLNQLASEPDMSVIVAHDLGDLRQNLMPMDY